MSWVKGREGWGGERDKGGDGEEGGKSDYDYDHDS